MGPAKKRKSDVPVFRPSMEQLEGSFEAYVESIERKFAGPGIAKIVPPKGWTPRKKGYAKVDIQIPQPIKQLATGSKGLYRLLLVQGKAQSLAKDFRPMATDKDNAPPCTDSREELERHYWRNLTLRPPHYGADIEGSLFDRGLKGWNLRHLDSLLTRTLKKKKISLPGCNTPMLYFGMWRSTFAWHTEDVDLASVNYLHYGAPKAWYCIPPDHRERFERMLKGMLPDLFRSCPEFMRHKELMVSPEFLRLHSIPVVKVMQYPGEFILNAPGAYHAGFNCGYNCAESVNFATKRWIITGAAAEPCRCNEDSIQMDMSMFLDAASPKARQAILDAQGESSSDSDSGDESQDSDDDSGAASHSESGNASRKAGPPAKSRLKPATSGSRNMAQAAESSSSSPAAQTASRKRGRAADDVSTETSAKRQAAAAARAERAHARAVPAGAEGRSARRRRHTRQSQVQPLGQPPWVAKPAAKAASRPRKSPAAGNKVQPRKAVRPAAKKGAGVTKGAVAPGAKRVQASAVPAAKAPTAVGGRGLLAQLNGIVMALRSQAPRLRRLKSRKQF